MNVPVHLSSVYRPYGAGAEYGRVDNPSWSALEEVVGGLEGGTAIAFASGLGASAALVHGLAPGSAVVAPRDSYHGFRALLEDAARHAGLDVRLVDVSDTAATLAACDGARLLWIESPTNPLMRIADLRTLVREASASGLLTVVDNTFASPILQRPLQLGASAVVHSATKLLGGHSDLMLGLVVTADPSLAEAIRGRRTLYGATPGPLEAFLALRGVRTLALRVERAQATAALLANRLGAHPAVTRVRYPGLESAPGHAIAASQMAGFGTVLSFEVPGGERSAEGVCRATRVIVHATSLGGVESLIDRRRRWPGENETPEGLVRLSAGCEDPEDLWEDLEQALAPVALQAASA